MTAVPPPSPTLVEDDVARALAEDLGGGDLTARLIPDGLEARAAVICREPAVICGTPWFDAVFHRIDPRVQVAWQVGDGDAVEANQALCTLTGPARAILSGERTALNFLQTLSGTATRTRQYAAAVAGTGVQVLDTRKTLPGLRLAQKYAVRCGGGRNHRMGLYDAILIKENHILAAGSIARAVSEARAAAPGIEMEVEVEVEDLEELQQALSAHADIILLDNFAIEDLRRATALAGDQAKLEASGGITLDNIRTVAETGVDYISIGALTKDIQAVDLSMRFEA